MEQLTGNLLKRGFDIDPVTLNLDSLHSSRPLPDNAITSRKFLQILASIATVGLVEPIIVTQNTEIKDSYRILDGRLRVEALRRLSITEVTCLIARDDEAYTYNKFINRLTPAQDARMIAKAIARGVPKDRIAAALGVDINTIRRRAMMLDGVCPEAASLIADRTCPAATYATLRLMKPLRQIEAAELMCGQSNFSSTFAKAILAATPDSQLAPQNRARQKGQSEAAAQLARLERELAALQTSIAQSDEQCGIDHLHLTVSAAYVAKLMHNQSIVAWIGAHHPEFLSELKAISDESGCFLPAVRQTGSRFKNARGKNVKSGSTRGAVAR
ncbi:plasmid partitioning protein RepB C-terminal domain-containing protein [Paraburkholderia hospita]|uniref:plasmid partitioning protein RepB C-terminal domain-containing protein n=1 Tax=Paraburkholderia hospita TaxID=169430 RepID=UPI000B34395E|nr:plasmid partitioning protein RepB C-terminal domain-containing protein [Paraburkholderia hospita]OUL72718.1 RepB plasmid partition [Paraburkholderia hospita]